VLLELLILISAISVTLAPTPIRSALFLMLTFLLSGLYLAQLGAELMALLFLFVIMLIDVAKNELQQYQIHDSTYRSHAEFNILFTIVSGFLILLFIYLIFLCLCYSYPITYTAPLIDLELPYEVLPYSNSQIHSLGTALFLHHWLSFIIVTAVIVVASFGVIILLK
jgi:NADH:ubiquinone oxidoreductase subunit 6 (subunit J)